jgi:endonuclease-3
VELEEPFKVLFATIISQRNRDELTEVVASRLFKKYPNITSLANASEKELSSLLYPTGFYREKAKKIILTAKIIKEKFNGVVPNTKEELLTLPGVGRKTANCVLAFGYKIPAIIVDTHVFRITQRLGWLKAKNPEVAEKKLEKIVPKSYWLDINRVIVQHGRNVCKPIGPKCLICPILNYCKFGQKKKFL